MKRYLRLLLPVICLLVCLCYAPVSAASVPGKVTGLKATNSDATITLRWNKASKAKKYAIYRVDAAGNQAKLVKKTSGRSCSMKGTIGVTYYFKVCALNSKGKSGAFSSVAAITPRVSAPVTPKNFALKSRGNKYITLKWSKAANASGYVIEAYNASTKSYQTVSTIRSGKTKEARISKLSEGTTYQYRIKSYRNVNGTTIYSNPSDVVTVKAVTLSSTVRSIRAPYYKVKTKYNVTAKNLSTGGSIVIKKGTALVVTSKDGKTVNGYLSSGTSISVARSALKYTGLDSRSSDYSTSIKEEFVNAKGYSSRTNYFIWISQYTYRVNIYKGSAGKWKLVKSYPCIVGKWNTRTSHGMRKILKKIRNGNYGAPYIYFTAGPHGSQSNPQGNAFHHYVDGNRTGAKSHGCVRLSSSALYYIYNNCRVGTAVLVY